MDYTRTYWLLFLGAGLLFTLSNYLDYAATGRVTLWIGISAVVGVIIVVVSAYAALNPEQVDGPTEPNFRFALAVGIFLFMAVVVANQLLGRQLFG